MSTPAGSTAPSSGRDGRVRAVIVPLTLLVLAALLAANLWQFDSPVPAATVVPPWVTNPATIRNPSMKPEIQLAGYSYRCSDCHKLFNSPAETTRSLTQHRDIVLKHGMNTRCFNCHHRTNRDALVDDWGREIPFDQPQLLCAKCHGPVYRDWLHGSHGRTSGYWDTARGPQVRAKCTQCHDPHQPPFPPMRPAPAPRTLRMGAPDDPTEYPSERDPLRVYQQLDSIRVGPVEEDS